MSGLYFELFVQFGVCFSQIKFAEGVVVLRALRDEDSFLLHALESPQRNVKLAEGGDILHHLDEVVFGLLRALVGLDDLGDRLGHPVVHELLHASAGLAESLEVLHVDGELHLEEPLHDGHAELEDELAGLSLGERSVRSL